MLSNTIPFYIFIIGFYILSFINVIPLKIKREQILFLKTISIFLLVVFAGCRWSPWEVGVDANIFDYDTYKIIYNTQLRLSNLFEDYQNSDYTIKTMEFGYICYSNLMHFIIGDNYNLYLLVTNTLLIYLLFRSFKVNGIIGGYFFLTFFYLSRLYLQYNFIIMRQAIALMIVWYAFYFLSTNHHKKFYLITIFASLFHSTALITLITPLLLKINIRNGLYITTCIIIFILNVLHITDLLLVNGIDAILSIFGNDGIGRYAQYILFDSETRGLNLLNFIEITPFIWISIRYKNDLIESSIGYMYVKMLYIYIFLMILTMNFGFLTRMTQYFMFSYIYLLHFYIVKVNSKNKRLILSILGLYLFIYASRYILIWFYKTPYSFFLFK